MHVYKCINKTKEGKVVTGYTLRNESTGQIIGISPDKLKEAIKQHNIKVVNLVLTSDNRLIDKNVKTDSIIQNYIEYCEIMGVKPLTIVKKNGKYIVVDIPENSKDITIPSFVSGIQLHKDIGSKQKVVSSNNELIKALNTINDKIDTIDKTTRELCNKQSESLVVSLAKLDEVKDEFNRTFSSIGDISSDVSVIKTMFKNITPKDIESINKISDVTNKLVDKALDNRNDLYSSSVVTDIKDISKDRTIGKDLNCLRSKEDYDKFNHTMNGTYVEYSHTSDIIPYINYSCNVYTDIAGNLAISLDLNSDKPGDTAKGVDTALGWIGYGVMAMYLASTTAEKLPIVAGVTFANAVVPKLSPLTMKQIEMDKINNTKKNTRKAFKYYADNLDRLKKSVDQLNEYSDVLDTSIYLLALQATVLTTTDSIKALYADGFCDRVIILTLFKIRELQSVTNYKDIELRVISSYLAACRYIDANYTFENDLQVDYVRYHVGSEVKAKLKNADIIKMKFTKESKEAYARQRVYYGFMIKWFEVALYQCGLNQALVNKIIAIFYAEAKGLKITPAEIPVNAFKNGGVNFDMRNAIIKQIELMNNE